MKLSEELQEEYDNDLERTGDDFKVWAERARVLEEKAGKWDEIYKQVNLFGEVTYKKEMWGGDEIE